MTGTSFWLQRSSRNYRNSYRQMHFRAQILRNPLSARAPSGARWGACKYNVPRPLLGWEGDTLPQPSLPLRLRAFQWGPGVVECVGPSRWLIRPWVWGYVLPLFGNIGLVICPNLHTNIEGGVGWSRNCEHVRISTMKRLKNASIRPSKQRKIASPPNPNSVTFLGWQSPRFSAKLTCAALV